VITSWVDVPDGSDFPLENLPLGVFEPAETPPGSQGRVGVAIGEQILDLAAVEAAGLLDLGAHQAVGPDAPPVFDRPGLEAVFALGRPGWLALRARLTELLAEDTPERGQLRPLLAAQKTVRMRLPFAVQDYANFYSSEQHARNLGRILRPGTEPLLPNWKRLPVGYHGRSGSVVVSGTPVVRPAGLVRRPGADAPTFEPCLQLDVELEVGTVVGRGWSPGVGPLPADQIDEHVFGFVLLNDWSARDLQAFEYQPLGPFLAKSLATTISPWVVMLEALRPFLVAGPVQDPVPHRPLRVPEPRNLDVQLELALNGTTASRTSFAAMYWSWGQQLVHYTSSGGCRPGDLLGSGTVSGDQPVSYGSLIELTDRGRSPLTLSDGSQRAFLEDGDAVTITGWAGGDQRPRVGFGDCSGTIHPSPEV
jgi:fumarylacetoacetase